MPRTWDGLVTAILGLPGVGPKMAERIALHLVRHEKDADALGRGVEPDQVWLDPHLVEPDREHRPGKAEHHGGERHGRRDGDQGAQAARRGGTARSVHHPEVCSRRPSAKAPTKAT